MADKTLTLAERREVFQALVEAQDQHMTAAQSRKKIAERFDISKEQARRIEREGLDGNWPTLE